MKRCGWCGEDAQYQRYHDTVWGRPERCGRELFKKLCLDGQQAGLSWITILRKQEAYERAFFDFDPEQMALMTEADIEQQMQNTAIVRNRLKIESLIRNARAYLNYEQQGDFAEFIWSFVGGAPIVNHWQSLSDVPAQTAESVAMSKALKKLGFNFVGPTICYAFMQACGLVIDHLTDCSSYTDCKQLAQGFSLTD
ncbi:DNA-3-methyladenine glycosylase I [Reinekea marinisedimentorum]|uniref:DNA-3-methyladenine glycosylase I n=1 Tax=Reinekea marinisedimentorum TaxID=230495 RepID=A0A4R3HWE5_9GAMM|nr:DNA-3-methyladenine glycosylase I [Reinekea marinisedimentorum]TCS37606.1 DNA-3-methyladenine glycosylase I [Reinekea marinisedimentorum]